MIKLSSKSLLGQFNTTKKDYILSGFEEFIPDKLWIDPYAGNGDLLDWVKEHGAKEIKGFDVDPNKPFETKNTLLDPPDYTNHFIIANPPYLAQNKCKDKSLYKKYNQDDLYKIAILTTIGCLGGIFIVPLNFLSSVYANSIRDIFFSRYEIIKCKIFEESVFEDTDYPVCAFYFEKGVGTSINAVFLPSQKEINLDVSEEFHWILGEEFYDEIYDIKTDIGRWTLSNGISENGLKGNVCVNDFNLVKIISFKPEILNDIILIRAIDTGSMKGRLGLYDIREFGHTVLLGLNTSRNLAHVKLDHFISIEKQLQVIKMVNEKLEHFREKYNSVFLTSFRNSTKQYSRKRIPFDAMYKMIEIALR